MTQNKDSKRNVALVYVRKSHMRRATSDTVDPASPEMQERACRELCAGRGWQSVEVFTDAEGHRSGRTENRPAYRALMARAKGSDVAAVVVYKYSRIARNVRLVLQILDELTENSVKLVSVSDSIDASTAQGRLLLTITASFDEHYSNDVGEWRADSIDALRRTSGRHYGLPPFGTRRELVNGDLVLRPSAVLQANGTDFDALNRLYFLYGSGAGGFRRVAVQLNSEGWRCRDRNGYERQWLSEDVRRMICSHYIYAGYVTVGRAYRNSDFELLPGSHSALLPEPLLKAAVTRFAGARQSYKQRSSPLEYPLTGVLYCACGERLVGENNRGRKYRHRLHCGNSWPTYMRAHELEQAVRERIADLPVPLALFQATDKEVLSQLAAVGNGQSQSARREQVQGALERLKELYIAGDVSKPEYDARRAAFAAQLPPEPSVPAAPPAETLAVQAFAERVLECGAVDLRDIVRSLYARVVVTDRMISSFEPLEWCAGWA